MNLETLTLGLILATGCVVGFFKLLELQDKWFNKMARGDGGLVI